MSEFPGGDPAACGCGNPDAHRGQPVVEVDEREALARGQRYAATHPEARSSRSQGLLAAGFRDGYVSGFRRSQPAPRTVSAAEVEAVARALADPYGDSWESYEPDARAAIAALGITVEAPRG